MTFALHTSPAFPSSLPRCSESKLGRAAGSPSLDSLQQALQGWTAAEMDAIEGKNPLHMAAWQGSLENVRHLIEHVGCNVNRISTAEFSYGKTPIFFAATRCRNDVVLYLLEQGAHVNIVNNKGQSVRSIASSHLLPEVVHRICQHELLHKNEPWKNYRATHSDQLEYGDLDPRFLDRPWRDTDLRTEHAVNPTTKRSRQGSFLRKNPHLSKPGNPTIEHKNSKPKRNQKPTVLTVEEMQQLNHAWVRVLKTIETAVVEKEEDHSLHLLLLFLEKDVFTIVQLSDKQHGPWIPEAAQRLQGVCRNQIHIVEYLTSLSSHSNNSSKRERILLQKLVSEIQGTRGEAIELPPIPAGSPDNFQSNVWKTQALLLDRREELELTLVTESMTRFQQHGHDGRLHLPEPPYWVDSVSTLQSLEEALMECRVAAIDTEWYTRLDGTIHVATLQVAIPGMPRPWVLDLLSGSLEYQQRAKQLVQRILFDPSRIVLGFAMGNDLPKLEEWLGADLPRNACLDVQWLHCNGGQLKGLASIVQLYSDIPLSKTEQCSSWSDRPLSDAQMEYAGLDAAILPVLVAEQLRQTNHR